MAQRVLAHVRPGSIVALDLGSDTHSSETVVNALPIVLQGLRARDLRPVRLDTLLESPGYTHCQS
jgi:hypothetical protein